MTLHFLNNVANDAGSTQKLKIYVILASLKSETMGKLINRIPGPCLLISNYPYSALRTHVVRSTSLAMSTSLLKALPGTFGIKNTHIVFAISRHASRCQQAISKPCLVNLISEDTHLVFSTYQPNLPGMGGSLIFSHIRRLGLFLGGSKF